jgi:hypothetical protein
MVAVGGSAAQYTGDQCKKKSDGTWAHFSPVSDPDFGDRCEVISSLNSAMDVKDLETTVHFGKCVNDPSASTGFWIKVSTTAMHIPEAPTDPDH